MSHSCNKELIKPSQPLPPNHCTICGNEDQNNTGSGEIGDRRKNSSTGSSRWNPTPEQLLALEELYRRGTRTPTTEQIQQIASKLRMFGNIEGKNVFYWFQNHKARERQKRRRHDGEANVLELQRNAAAENSHAHKDLSVLRRTGARRVEQTNKRPSSSLSHELIPVTENGTTKESERVTENGQHATWQNPMFIRSASLLVNPSSNASDRNADLHNILDNEEEAREIRTLNLFPVSENREKTDATEGETGPVEYTWMTKPSQSFYEFIPLKN